MAPHVQLPQVARHHLRHRPDPVPVYRRGERQQVPDPAVRRRRAGARPAGARRRDQRLRRVRAYAHLFLLRQGPDARLRHRPAVRPQQPPPAVVVGFCRRRGDRQHLAEEAQRLRHPGRQLRHADGRLVPQGDRDRRRPEGPQVPHRRHGRAGVRAARRRAAADRARRHLSGARARHHRCGRVRRSLRRREARLLQGRQELLLPRLVGGQRHAAPVHQPGEVERAAQALSVPRAPGLRCGQHLDARQVRHGQRRGAASA